MISDMFENLADFRMFLRRADNFLPDKFEKFDITSLKASKVAFISFQRDAQRKRLAADVEIKVGYGLMYDDDGDVFLVYR